MQLPSKQPKITAKDLVDKGVRYIGPKESLRARLLAMRKEMASIQDLYPNTILEEETFESLTSALISKGHVLLFGPSGSGKTNLAKDITTLFPKEVHAVERCPVLDSPFSLISPEVAKDAPPCPFCKSRFGELGFDELGNFNVQDVDPAKVPVVRAALREGYGFARIQGSSEVFPDNLTGNINLHKLEQIGDPESPLVLEPGKLLQANRGVLLIDEIGKIPLGSQNVLLQALQEGIVTPAKSRETFPARFVAVCTSNVSDLDNINEPLSDRLISVHIPYNRSHGRNKRIVEMGYKPSLFMPEPFLDGAVGTIEQWRSVVGDNPDLSEVGSNRSMTDLVLRTESFALLCGRRYPAREDYVRGVREGMAGRIRARGGDSFEQNMQIIASFLDSNLKKELHKWSKICWCRFFKYIKERRETAEGVVREFRRIKDDPTMVPKIGESFQNFALFADYCKRTYGCTTEDAVYLFSVMYNEGLFEGEIECGKTDDKK